MKLALILVIGLYNAASVQGSRLCVTLFALSLDAPSWLVGSLAALYYVLPIFLGLAIGRAIDRAGTGPTVATCGALSLLSYLIPLLMPGLVSLAISACLAGVSFVAVSVAANVMVPKMGSPEDTSRNYAWYALASSVGMAVGPLISGFGIDHVGHRFTFALLTVIPLVMLVVLYAGWRMMPAAAARNLVSSGRLRDLARSPGVPVPLVGAALAPVVLDLFFFVVPLYGTSIGLSASTIGVVLGVFSGASVSVRLLLPVFARFTRPWTLVAGSFAMSGFMLGLMPLASGTPMLIAFSVLAGVSTGVSAPMVLTVLAKTLPEGRQGELLGVRAILQSFGQMAGPALVGALSGLAGLAPVVGVMGLGVMYYGWQARREGLRRGALQ